MLRAVLPVQWGRAALSHAQRQRNTQLAELIPSPQRYPFASLSSTSVGGKLLDHRHTRAITPEVGSRGAASSSAAGLAQCKNALLAHFVVSLPCTRGYWEA